MKTKTMIMILGGAALAYGVIGIVSAAEGEDKTTYGIAGVLGAIVLVSTWHHSDYKKFIAAK